MATGKDYLEQLRKAGWTVTEKPLHWLCVSPEGKAYLYTALDAVRYGTWHDVAAAKDVPLHQSPDTIVITAPAGTKARWVRQSQAEGVKLSDWVIHKVEQA
jgi:hypothetical protein